VRNGRPTRGERAFDYAASNNLKSLVKVTPENWFRCCTSGHAAPKFRTREWSKQMKSLPALVAAALVSLLPPVIANAAPPCPTEVKEARELLTAKTKTATAKTTQPSKSLAAVRQQDIQAPRANTQDVQAPRSSTQDVQAPRASTQDVQAPRASTQDVQAPRSSTQDVQAPRTKNHPEPPEGPAPRNVAKGRATALTNARRLVAEAETACKDADGERALANAHAALDLLKYVP
jgi:hypothetical protein